MKEVAFLTKNKVSTIYTHRKNIRSKYNIEISSLILDLKEQGII
jgi:DNA-binding CsgD family transcriptional regulator